jgi:hypothetical protein
MAQGGLGKVQAHSGSRQRAFSCDGLNNGQMTALKDTHATPY